jgi:hypothetical protein
VKRVLTVIIGVLFVSSAFGQSGPALADTLPFLHGLADEESLSSVG